MKVISSRSYAALALIPLALLFQGCDQEDLSAVESLKPTAETLSLVGSSVSADSYGSCVRRERMDLEVQQATSPRSLETQFIPAVVLERCKTKESHAYTASQLNTTLVAYAASLLNLASNQTVDFSQNINSLGVSIAAVYGAAGQPIESSVIDGGTSILRSAMNMWSARFRRESLSEVVICTSESVNRYVSGLDSLVRNSYITALDSERDSIILYINNKYIGIYREFEADGDLDKYTRQRSDLEAELNGLMEALGERQRNARVYQDVLSTTANTHQALADTFRGDMTAENVSSLCGNYFDDEQVPVADEVTESSIKAEIVMDLETSRQIRKILINHVQSVEEAIANR
jgi:hypothetical protein